jgi:hypothetical protein
VHERRRGPARSAGRTGAGRPFFTDACHAGIHSVDGTFDAEALLAGDRAFHGDLLMTSAAGTSRIAIPGLGAKRALSLAGTTLTVAGESCAGAVTVQAVELTQAGTDDGCPVELTTGTLRLKRNRTITVAARCRNGCDGLLNLESGDVRVTAALKAAPGARATMRFRLTRAQAKRLRKTARFWSYEDYLTVKGTAHRIR